MVTTSNSNSNDSDHFLALLITKDESGLDVSIAELSNDQLPEGEVTVAVEYSTLNYKDGMILQGIGGLVRHYPHIGGVDFAGTVESSQDARYSPGDKVISTGWRVGENRWGGYSQRARVKANWLVGLPEPISTRQAMAVGTAGFTAMQALMALEQQGLEPGQPLLVTGASGGVGSAAVLWASLAGHHVIASTGRPENSGDLLALGAAEVIDRAELAEAPGKPLLKERWAGCIDAVGGDSLAHILAETKALGSVAACGLAGGNGLNTTVIPFLLRGINLLGIDSVMCPQETRTEVWGQIAEALSNSDTAAKFESLTSEVELSDLAELAPKILAGQVKGRTLVKIDL